MNRISSPFAALRAAVLAAAATAVVFSVACEPPPKNADGKPVDGKPGETKKPADVPDGPKATGPVANVNGKPIERDDFEKQMTRTRARFKRAGREISAPLENRLKENLIRKLIDEQLIEQKATSEGINVDGPALDAKYKEHRDRFGSDKAFTAFLDRTNQTEADVRADLKKNLLRDQLFEKLMGTSDPSDADVKDYYEKNKAKYKQKEQVRASHVLLKVARDAKPEEKAAKLKVAKDVLAKAKKGTDFAALAKEHSEGPTASRGGDLGKFSRGRMVKAFEDAAFAAKPGSILGPIETQFGYHVIKVFEKTPERERNFDEVKDSIMTSLKARQKSKATRDTLKKLKAEAKVEILEPGVDLDRRARARAPVTPGGKPMLPDAALKRLRRDAATTKPGGATPHGAKPHGAMPGAAAPAPKAPAAEQK